MAFPIRTTGETWPLELIKSGKLYTCSTVEAVQRQCFLVLRVFVATLKALLNGMQINAVCSIFCVKHLNGRSSNHDVLIKQLNVVLKPILNGATRDSELCVSDLFLLIVCSPFAINHNKNDPLYYLLSCLHSGNDSQNNMAVPSSSWPTTFKMTSNLNQRISNPPISVIFDVRYYTLLFSPINVWSKSNPFSK